ncbi:hypothetical protein TNCV_4263101 [Trichonephila clavipes]|nr:hypothetical protein TNCV_4263101 [Trichonephila clavipes]
MVSHNFEPSGAEDPTPREGHCSLNRSGIKRLPAGVENEFDISPWHLDKNRQIRRKIAKSEEKSPNLKKNRQLQSASPVLHLIREVNITLSHSKFSSHNHEFVTSAVES